jgi:hypothetical protein
MAMAAGTQTRGFAAYFTGETAVAYVANPRIRPPSSISWAAKRTAQPKPPPLIDGGHDLISTKLRCMQETHGNPGQRTPTLNPVILPHRAIGKPKVLAWPNEPDAHDAA